VIRYFWLSGVQVIVDIYETQNQVFVVGNRGNYQKIRTLGILFQPLGINVIKLGSARRVDLVARPVRVY